jgi:Mg-chelatase subunit ChlD
MKHNEFIEYLVKPKPEFPIIEVGLFEKQERISVRWNIWKNILRCAIFLVPLIFSFPTFADTIQGIVLDSNNRPVPGAFVSSYDISTLKITNSDETNSNGEYSLELYSGNAYLLVPMYRGMNYTHKLIMTDGKNKSVNFSLPFTILSDRIILVKTHIPDNKKYFTLEVVGPKEIKIENDSKTYCKLTFYLYSRPEAWQAEIVPRGKGVFSIAMDKSISLKSTSAGLGEIRIDNRDYNPPTSSEEFTQFVVDFIGEKIITVPIILGSSLPFDLLGIAFDLAKLGTKKVTLGTSSTFDTLDPDKYQLYVFPWILLPYKLEPKQPVQIDIYPGFENKGTKKVHAYFQFNYRWRNRIPSELAGIGTEFEMDVTGRDKKVGPYDTKQAIATAFTSTILLLDVSSSMGTHWQGGVKIASMKEAASRIVNMLSAENKLGYVEHKIGVVSFESVAKTIAPLKADFQDVNSEIMQLRDRRNTNIGDALMKGLNLLEKEGTQINRIMVLLTDGERTVGLSNDQIITGPVAEAKRKGIRIFTIGFGDAGGIDEGFLKQIAQATNAQYFYALDANKLDNVYVSIGHKTGGSVINSYTGEVAQGETVVAGSFNVPVNSPELRVTLNWPGSWLDLFLKDPQGVEVQQGYPGFQLFKQAKPIYAVVRKPLAGTWTASVKGVDVPQGKTSFEIIGSLRTPYVPFLGGGYTPPRDKNDWLYYLLIILVVACLGLALAIVLVLRQKRPDLFVRRGGKKR